MDGDPVRTFPSPSVLGTGHGNSATVGVRFGARRLPTLRNVPRVTVTIRFCRRHRCVIVPTRLGGAPVSAAMSLAVNVGGNRSKIWCQLVFPQKLATS